MRRRLWMVLLALALAAAAHAAGEAAGTPAGADQAGVVSQANRLPFVDEWTAGDLPVYGKALGGLATIKPEGLTSEPDYNGAKVRYATFRFRESEKVTVTCALALAEAANGEKTLYLDGDGDGKLTEAEKATPATAEQRPPDFGAAGESIWLAKTSKPFARTLAIRLSPFGGTINCGVRGYCRGTLPIAGQQRDAVLVDANGNMLLETTRDRAYVDLNGDGKFDPTSERFPLMGRLEFGDEGFAFADVMTLDEAYWKSAPMGKAPVTFGIAKLLEKPQRFSATLSRRGGGVFQVTELGKQLSVPAGIYVVDSLFLRLPAAGGAVHEYTFDGRDASKVINLEGQEPCNVELIGDVTLTVTVRGDARPGSTLTVEDSVKTATGLVLATHTSGGRQVPPQAVLTVPGKDEPIATGITNYG